MKPLPDRRAVEAASVKGARLVGNLFPLHHGAARVHLTTYAVTSTPGSWPIVSSENRLDLTRGDLCQPDSPNRRAQSWSSWCMRGGAGLWGYLADPARSGRALSNGESRVGVVMGEARSLAGAAGVSVPDLPAFISISWAPPPSLLHSVNPSLTVCISNCLPRDADAAGPHGEPLFQGQPYSKATVYTQGHVCVHVYECGRSHT